MLDSNRLYIYNMKKEEGYVDEGYIVVATPRFHNPDCKCPTYPGNLGPCAKHTKGSNGRCVYCDHELNCTPKRYQL